MRTKKMFATAGLGLVAALGVAGPSVAQQDIPYTWNSNDNDSKARFESEGEHFYAYEYRGSNYVDYRWGSNSTQRWSIPGNEDKSRKDLNLTMSEGLGVWMKVCQNKENFPDDCSDPEYGVC